MVAVTFDLLKQNVFWPFGSLNIYLLCTLIFLSFLFLSFLCCSMALFIHLTEIIDSEVTLWLRFTLVANWPYLDLLVFSIAALFGFFCKTITIIYSTINQINTSFPIYIVFLQFKFYMTFYIFHYIFIHNININRISIVLILYSLTI